MKLSSLLAFLALLGATPRTAATDGVQFKGGRWFDGSVFVVRDFFVVDGVLTARKPDRVERVVDLTGKFVVPPYGDAHNHNVEPTRVDAVTQMYLQRGVFYVKNPSSVSRFTAQLGGKINTPTSVDVVFSEGGLTSTGGHPVWLAKRQIDAGRWETGDGDGGFFYIVDTRADLDRRWPEIAAGRRDFLKTFLIYFEEYAKRRDDLSYQDWRGLDPALLPKSFVAHMKKTAVCPRMSSRLPTFVLRSLPESTKSIIFLDFVPIATTSRRTPIRRATKSPRPMRSSPQSGESPWSRRSAICSL